MLILLNQPHSLPLPGFVLGEGALVCGRSLRCHLIVPHPTVSRRHAEFRVDGGHVEVRDLHSHNGTFVDGVRVESAELDVGHLIRFGKVSFLLDQADGNPSACGSLFDTASVQRSEPSTAEADVLSQAERRVLDLALTGLVEKQIARRLNISRHTAHNHLRRIYRTLGVHSRGELLAHLLNRPH